MSNRTAIIVDSHIENVILTDESWTAPPGVTAMLESQALANGIPYKVRPVPVPETVTGRQLRLWLAAHKKPDGVTTFFKATTAAINAITPEEERLRVQIEFEHVVDIHRAHPLVLKIGTELGLTSDAMDQAFREASFL